jgi:hypothetical protein
MFLAKEDDLRVKPEGAGHRVGQCGRHAFWVKSLVKKSLVKEFTANGQSAAQT